MSSAFKPNLDQLYARVERVFRRGGGTRAEVSLVRTPRGLAVLKDYNRSDPRFRRAVGALLVRREAQALRRLAGVHGVPRLVAVPDRCALLVEYLPGRALGERNKRHVLKPEFFEKFYGLLDAMHRRGIAHCDLRSRGNILLGPKDEPYLVDFVANFKRGHWWNPLTRWMFARFCEADRMAVARVKRAYARKHRTAEERALLKRDRKTLLERSARVLGRGTRDLSRWLLTRRK